MVQTRKSKQTRNRLIDTGIELLRKKGMKKFSIREVARECGMSPKAPYNYFEDAAAFLAGMRHQIFREMMKRLYSDEVLRETDPFKRITELEKEFYAYHEKYFPLLRQIFIKAPMTQYYIEEDGAIWQYVTDYPVVIDGQDDWNLRWYKQMIMGALIKGMPYTAGEWDDGTRIERILKAGMSCLDNKRTGGEGE